MRCLGLLKADKSSEAVEWTRRFLEVLGEGECELRPIFASSDFGEEFTPEQRVAEEGQRARMAENAKP